MEGLKELEKVQNVIELLHSHSIIDSSIQNPESHRFLADFTLFLIQQHNELKVDAKCQLISDYVKKISASFLDEALKSIGEEGNGNIRDAIPPDDKAGIEASPNDFQDVAMVGLDAMQRANSTLEDFMRSYLMFHKMDVHQPQSIFRIYGASAAPYKLAKRIAEAEEKYETMLKSLEPDLAMKYQRRCEEATKEGGKISGPSLGTWNIPTIIEDEDKYRCNILTAET